MSKDADDNKKGESARKRSLISRIMKWSGGLLLLIIASPFVLLLGWLVIYGGLIPAIGTQLFPKTWYYEVKVEFAAEGKEYTSRIVSKCQSWKNVKVPIVHGSGGARSSVTGIAAGVKLPSGAAVLIRIPYLCRPINLYKWVDKEKTPDYLARMDQLKDVVSGKKPVDESNVVFLRLLPSGGMAIEGQTIWPKNGIGLYWLNNAARPTEIEGYFNAKYFQRPDARIKLKQISYRRLKSGTPTQPDKKEIPWLSKGIPFPSRKDARSRWYKPQEVWCGMYFLEVPLKLLEARHPKYKTFSFLKSGLSQIMSPGRLGNLPYSFKAPRYHEEKKLWVLQNEGNATSEPIHFARDNKMDGRVRVREACRSAKLKIGTANKPGYMEASLNYIDYDKRTVMVVRHVLISPNGFFRFNLF